MKATSVRSAVHILPINMPIKQPTKTPVHDSQGTRHLGAFEAIQTFIETSLALGPRLKLISLVTDAVTI
jgi:hypothetical protein